MQHQRKKPVSNPFNFDAPFSEEPARVGTNAESDAKSDDSRRFVDKKAAARHRASQDTRRYSQAEWELNGGNGYDIDYAGPGSSEFHVDTLLSELRLMQDPDLLGGEWLNVGGHYDRRRGKWFNSGKDATGISISVIRDVVLMRVIQLGLTQEVIDKYVLRTGRSIEEEQRFYRMPFETRMEALRTGEAQ
jgi:hypothetical protein